MPEVPLPAGLSLKEKRIVRSLEPVLQVLAVEHHAALRSRGLRLIFNSGTRTQAQQDAIVARTSATLTRADTTAELNRAGLSGFAAKGKKSLHLFRLAYDGEPKPKTDQTWEIYGEEAETLGLTWGGRWIRKLPSGETRSDRPHVQMGGDAGLVRQLAGVGIFGTVAVAIAILARTALRPGKG